MIINFLEKEFTYQGINSDCGCFVYTKEISFGVLIIHVYDDAFITAHREWSNKATNEYLITSVSHLLSAILDGEEWETYTGTNTHEALAPVALRRLLLNAPRMREQLKSHPQYAFVMSQISNQLGEDTHKQRAQDKQIEDIRKMSSDDPFRAYSEAYSLSAKFPDDERYASLLEDMDIVRLQWTKVINYGRDFGMEEAKRTLDSETFSRLKRALHWKERDEVSYKQEKPKHLMDCSGVRWSPPGLKRRIAKLVSIYPEVDEVTLEAIILFCDQSGTLIDLTQPLENQFTIKSPD